MSALVYDPHHFIKYGIPCKVRVHIAVRRLGTGMGAGRIIQQGLQPGADGFHRGVLWLAGQHNAVGIVRQQLLGSSGTGAHDGAAAGRGFQQGGGKALGIPGGQTVYICLPQQLDHRIMRQGTGGNGPKVRQFLLLRTAASRHQNNARQLGHGLG